MDARDMDPDVSATAPLADAAVKMTVYDKLSRLHSYDANDLWKDASRGVDHDVESDDHVAPPRGLDDGPLGRGSGRRGPWWGGPERGTKSEGPLRDTRRGGVESRVSQSQIPPDGEDGSGGRSGELWGRRGSYRVNMSLTPPWTGEVRELWVVGGTREDGRREGATVSVGLG